MSTETTATEAPEQKKPRTWTADTIMRKHMRIDDPATHEIARENLKNATAQFVSRLDLDPTHDLAARLVIGFKESHDPFVLELTRTGSLREAFYSELDEAGMPKGRQAPDSRRDSRRPRFHLNSYAAMALVTKLTQDLKGWYAYAFHEAARQTGQDANTTKGFDVTLERIASNVVGQRIGTQLRELRKHLDEGALKIMNRAADHRIELYNMLTAADKGSDKTIARNRQQACAAFPLLPSFLLSHTKLRKDVDTGKPMKQAIADAYQHTHISSVPTAVTGRLQGLNWQMTSRATYQNPLAFLQVIADTPLDWLPNKRAGWSALQQIWEHGNQHLKDQDDMIRPFKNCNSIGDFMKVMGQDWTLAMTQLDQHGGLRGVGDCRREIFDHAMKPLVTRYVRGLCEKNGYSSGDPEAPMGYGDTPPNVTIKEAQLRFEHAFNTGFTIPQALQKSQEWHDRLDTLNAAVHGIKSNVADGEPVVWGKAFPDWQHPGDLQVVMLASETELRDEGLRMNHCVGGYATNVTTRGSIILSIRDEKDRSISTVEICEDPDKTTERKPQFKVRQHYGEHDMDPPAKAETVLEAWLEAANNGKIAYDRKGLQGGRENALMAIQRNASAESEMTEEQRQKLWDLHTRFMPKPMRDAGSPEAWLNKSGILPILDRAFTQTLNDLREDEKCRAERREQFRRNGTLEANATTAQPASMWQRALNALGVLNPNRDMQEEPAR